MAASKSPFRSTKIFTDGHARTTYHRRAELAEHTSDNAGSRWRLVVIWHEDASPFRVPVSCGYSKTPLTNKEG